MRIGRMNKKIEVWDNVERVSKLGIVEKTPELLIICPAAFEFLSSDHVGSITKGVNKKVKVTIRHNRQYKIPSESMFIKFDGKDWDIIDDENWYGMNKYTVLTCVLRGKKS
ncbi:head-tail adaptor protein [Aeromonas salmonicida]|uniref:head-tail adaptor protein n=1 Tax=Aeromonas salmonicida TaxID=645 RepID=UPI003D31B77B